MIKHDGHEGRPQPADPRPAGDGAPRMRPPSVGGAAGEATEVPTPQARLVEIRRGYRKGAEPEGIEPTRFGDWEYGGRCTDF